MSTAPILVIEHQADCPPAWMAEWLCDAGAVLDLRRPYLGEALPHHLGGHSGMVILGGSMNAVSDDEYPWLTTVKELIESAVVDGTPTLGICLGHQLIACALGGQVTPNPLGQQIGVLDIGWRPEARDDPLFGSMSGERWGVQWNNDIVSEVPAEAVVLASTSRDEIQACRYAAAVWGVQWHPEAGAEIITVWAEDDRDHAQSLGIDLDRHITEIAAARDELRSSWRKLADSFAARARGATIS